MSKTIGIAALILSLIAIQENETMTEFYEGE